MRIPLSWEELPGYTPSELHVVVARKSESNYILLSHETHAKAKPNAQNCKEPLHSPSHHCHVPQASAFSLTYSTIRSKFLHLCNVLKSGSGSFFQSTQCAMTGVTSAVHMRLIRSISMQWSQYDKLSGLLEVKIRRREFCLPVCVLSISAFRAGG